jgi:hypothetical protein
MAHRVRAFSFAKGQSMTRPNVQSWDPAAINNTDVGGISLAENIMRPPAVNNALRELMAEVARLYDDLGGINTVAGTGDAITLTTASTAAALATGLVLSFRAAANNTTNVTINVDGLGAKAIRKVTNAETALVAGDLVAGGKYLLVYDAAANGAAGAWKEDLAAWGTSNTFPWRNQEVRVDP